MDYSGIDFNVVWKYIWDKNSQVKFEGKKFCFTIKIKATKGWWVCLGF